MTSNETKNNLIHQASGSFSREKSGDKKEEGILTKNYIASIRKEHHPRGEALVEKIIKYVRMTQNIDLNTMSRDNQTGTSKVGAISKAQKAALKKNLKFLIFFQKMSHSAEKCKRGTLWALLTYILLQNIKKLERGTL